MKASFLFKVFFACLLAVLVASCRSSRTTRAPYPDAKRYPSGGSVHRLPPGQAKKVYGYQSARAFAPGQQKKGYSHPSGKQDKHRGGKKGKK